MATRYIDAEKLNRDVLASWDKDKHYTIEASRVHRQEHRHLMRIIEKQPTADVVEVVRCEECTYWKNRRKALIENDVGDCHNDNFLFRCESLPITGAMHFCSYGKRKGGRNDKQ